MLVYDLHNDLLTAKENLLFKTSFIKQQIKIKTNIILAIWTSKMRYVDKCKLRYIIKPFLKYPNIRFAIEDIRFINMKNIYEILTLPIDIYGISWNNDTSICGGCYSTRGLSGLGKEVVKILLSKNKIIDLAHSNEKTIEDVFKLSRRNNIIINSHCCLKSVYKHNRNISDDVIREIIFHNGVVGITFVRAFFNNNTNLFIKNFTYFINNFSNQHICLGTDYFGSTDFLDFCKNYNILYKLYNILIDNVGLINANNIFWRNAKNFYCNYKKRHFNHFTTKWRNAKI